MPSSKIELRIPRIVSKCRKRVNVIKCRSVKDWGNSMEPQQALYIQYVRSAPEYASLN